MVGKVSVLNSRELQATLFAIKAAPADIRKQLRGQTRKIIGHEWEQALRAEPATVQQSRLLVNTARVRVSDQSVQMRSASSSRKVLSGGAVPVRQGKAFEFGSSKGHGRQLPRPRRGGYIVYPAFAKIAPRALSLWVQTTVRSIAEALEGKHG